MCTFRSPSPSLLLVETLQLDAEFLRQLHVVDHLVSAKSVSPNWNNVFTGSSAPLSYSEPDADKVVILMTDGSFNAEIFPEQGTSDEQARALCDNMKRTSIQVYAVALNAPTAGKRVLQYCASGADYYFEPETAAELTEAYRKIATSISDLRISQ